MGCKYYIYVFVGGGYESVESEAEIKKTYATKINQLTHGQNIKEVRILLNQELDVRKRLVRRKS